MAAPNVVVKGVKDVIHGLDVFHGKVDAELRKTLARAANDIHLAVKAVAPVRTGRYRNSIHWTMSPTGLIAWVYASRKAPGVIRGSQYDTHNAEEWAYAARRKRPKTRRSRKGYIGHLLEYGTVRARPRPHWTPARTYMVMQFGGMLEIAIKSVRMYHTRADTPRLTVGNFRDNQWTTSSTPQRLVGHHHGHVGRY